MSIETGVINNSSSTPIISATGDVLLQTLASGKGTKVINSNGVVATFDGSGNLVFDPTNGGSIRLGLTDSLQMKSGTNAMIGSATLVGGTVTVANTAVTANSVVLAICTAVGGAQGILRTSVSAGVSFTITSSSGTDTSTVAYVIFSSF